MPLRQLLPTRTAPSFTLLQQGPAAHWGLSWDASSDRRGLPEPSEDSSSARSSLSVSTAVFNIFSFYRTFYSRLSDLPMKEWKGVCLSQRNTLLTLESTWPRTSPWMPQMEWTGHEERACKKLENRFGGVKGEVKFQIREFSYAIFQRFYTQILHLISYDTWLWKSSNRPQHWMCFIVNIRIATIQRLSLTFCYSYLSPI